MHATAPSAPIALPRRLTTALLVLAMAAGLLLAVPAPAQAAVTVTPVEGSAAPPTVVGCERTVDITVVARMSEPVRFAEVALNVAQAPSGAPASGRYRAKSGDLGTFVVFIFEVYAPVPGTYSFLPRWAAHNGNGLSQGTAYGDQITFTIPEAPRRARFDEIEKCNLSAASAYTNVAGGVLTLGGLGVAAIAGSIACPPCGAIGVGIAVLGALSAIAGGVTGRLALDPPDDRYTEIVQPVTPQTPTARAGGGVSQRTADALNAATAHTARVLGLTQAVLTSVERAEGANIAGDLEWERRQMVAAGDYARQAAAAMRAEPPLRVELRAALEADGVPNTRIGASTLAGLQQQVLGSGLPPELRDAIAGIGSAEDHAWLRGRMAATDPEALSQVGFLDMVAPPDFAAQLESLAAQMDDFADEIARDPLDTAGQGSDIPPPPADGPGTEVPPPSQGGRGDLVASYDLGAGLGSQTPGAPAARHIGAGPLRAITDPTLGEGARALEFPYGGGFAIDLPPSMPNDVYTIITTLRFDELESWQRILDFKVGHGDAGLYALNGALNFYTYATGPERPIQPDRWVQVALTRSPDGEVTGYVDGVEQFRFADERSGAVFSTEDQLRLFVDNDRGGGPTNEMSPGAVSCVQLYDGVLTADQIAASTCSTGTPVPTPRVDGDVRRVAINLCQQLFGEPDQARAVILARDDVFADALAGAPLAGDDACILYTAGGPDAPLDAGTRAEIDRALPDGGLVQVLGGANAVSSLVEDELAGAGYAVERFEGPSRFETAASIAGRVAGVAAAEGRGTGAVMLAYGLNSPDAVTGGAYGAASGTPIVLTDTASLHPAAAEAIAEIGATRTYVLGGEAVISAAAAAATPAPQRIEGSNRMSTAVAVARQLWPQVDRSSTVVALSNLARPDGWPLTLAGAPLSARYGAPQLGVGDDLLPAETRTHLEGRDPQPRTAYLLGDTSYISDGVAAEVGALLAP